jgi:hypothetical protein
LSKILNPSEIKESVARLNMNSLLSTTRCLAFSLCLVAWQVVAGESTPVPDGAVLPHWPKPQLVSLPSDALSIRSRDLELTHAPDGLGKFVVRVGGQVIAIGQNRPLVGYVKAGELRWFGPTEVTNRNCLVRAATNTIRVNLEAEDLDHGHWLFEQVFTPGVVPGSLDVESAVSVDQDRAVAFLPMLTLFPGVGSFGEAKGQALLPGLEYLENEPSSSEADVVGPAARRQVPDNLKLTFPLMAIQHQGRFLALTWQMHPYFSAVFDSPDRLFGSGGHVMGLLFPGSNGTDRQEGNLLPKVCGSLAARQRLRLRATLLGGSGKSVAAAVEHYVSLRGLPAIPPPPELQQYVSAAAGSWLDSKIRSGNLFHHAIAGGHFPAAPAADAGLWMDWLASRTQDAALTSRLVGLATNALASVPPDALNFSGVGHVRYPAAALVYGHIPENITKAEAHARELLNRFDAEGAVRYHPSPGGPDYARTHCTNEANGLTSRVVQDLLETAAFSGNRELLEQALQHLRGMQKFANGVPRGAQTWECPLHTPDILASAQMVRAYTLGYELSGDPEFLKEARYWAWTGVPFVYLVNPAGQPVGLYTTIAVYGATQWRAPVWMGLPVQWCGLVYADALYRLVRHDPTGPWKRLADGITVSGMQQAWPEGEPELRGLLPDSFVLREQKRNGPAINPATTQACAAQFFSAPVYDFWSCRRLGLLIHAPGQILNVAERQGRVSFDVKPWVNRPCYVLVNGLKEPPALIINGKKVQAPDAHQFWEGRLLVRITGSTRLELLIKK